MTATVDTREPRVGTSRPHARMPALDGLRGLAVLLVLAYHGDKLDGGFLGVDLFFVLSGFLITRVILGAWSSDGGFRFGAFWWRRVQRLLPALLLMLLVVIPLFATRYATSVEKTVLFRDGLGTIFYAANWEQIWFGSVYGDRDLIAPLRHTWSLAVEEQVYLIWPIIAIFLLRRGGSALLTRGATILAAASAGLTILIATTETFSLNSLYLGTHSRAAAVMAGAAFAAHRHGRRRSKTTGPNLGLDAAAGVAILLFLSMCLYIEVGDRILYTGGLVVTGLCGLVLVAATSRSELGPIATLLTFAPLRFMGTISYAVYLWSWPIMQILSERNTSMNGWGLFAFQVALTLAVASISWFALERPVLDGTIGRRSTAMGVLIATVLALIALQVTTLDREPLVDDSRSTAGYSGGGDVPKLLTLGDSVPARIADEGIIPLADELGVSAADRSRPGCILLREKGIVRGFDGAIRTDVTACAGTWEEDVAELEPDLVLVMFGQFATDEVELAGQYRKPCDPEYAEAQRALLDDALDRVAAPGRRLFISTMPGSNTSWLIERNPDLNEQMACLDAVYGEVAGLRDDTQLIDFGGWICPQGLCKNKIDGVDLREDLVHFRSDAAELVGRWLVDRILDAPDEDPTQSDQTQRTCAALDELVNLLVASDGDGAAELQGGALELLRDTDVDEVIASFDPAVQDPLQTLHGNLDAIIERVAAVPPGSPPEAYQTALGDLITPLQTLGDWHGANC